MWLRLRWWWWWWCPLLLRRWPLLLRRRCLVLRRRCRLLLRRWLLGRGWPRRWWWRRCLPPYHDRHPPNRRSYPLSRIVRAFDDVAIDRINLIANPQAAQLTAAIRRKGRNMARPSRKKVC